MKIRAEASPASLAGREASPPCSVFVRMHGIYALNCSGFAAEIKKRASIHITILSVMYSECLVRVTYYILTIKCLWAFVKFFILLFPTFLPFTLLPACAYTAQAAHKYTLWADRPPHSDAISRMPAAVRMSGLLPRIRHNGICFPPMLHPSFSLPADPY